MKLMVCLALSLLLLSCQSRLENNVKKIMDTMLTLPIDEMDCWYPGLGGCKISGGRYAIYKRHHETYFQYKKLSSTMKRKKVFASMLSIMMVLGVSLAKDIYYMKTTVCILSLGLLLLNCNNNKNVSTNSSADIDIIERIQVDSLKKMDKDVYAHFPREIVPLETTIHSLLKEPKKILTDKQLFFILDVTDNVLVFDRDGHFLRKIGAKGHSLSEYVKIMDIFIDKDKQTINIVDNVSSKINTYTFEGAFIKSTKLEHEQLSSAYRAHPISSHELLMEKYNYTEAKSNYTHVIYGQENAKATNIIPYIFMGKMPLQHSSSNKVSIVESEFLLTADFSDTIYQFRHGEVIPRYILDSNLTPATYEACKNQDEEASAFIIPYLRKKGISSGIENFFATKQHLYMEYSFGGDKYKIMYDRLGHKGIIHKYIDKDFPNVWEGLISSTENEFICCIPIEKAQYIVEEQNDSLLQEVVRNCSDEDNPLIIIYHDVIQGQ